jgi:hypothetical protein
MLWAEPGILYGQHERRLQLKGVRGRCVLRANVGLAGLPSCRLSCSTTAIVLQMLLQYSLPCRTKFAGNLECGGLGGFNQLPIGINDRVFAIYSYCCVPEQALVFRYGSEERSPTLKMCWKIGPKKTP